MLDKNKMITTFIFILIVGAVFYPHILFAATANQTVHITIVDVPQDTMAPTVSITSPKDGVTVSGTITVSANASDNVGVAGVQFKLDGVNLGAEDTTSPYAITWDTTTTTNSAHTLTAIARDNAGNSAASSAVNITVNNILPDTQAPTTPTGLTVAAISSSQINLSWTASTDDVGVAGYKIYRDDILRGTIDEGGGTSYSDSGLQPDTTYTYAVSAYDAAGNESGKSGTASATTLTSTGNTYYISPVGNDTTGNGSNTSPWATLSKSFSQMQGGDTLIIKDGVYKGVLNAIHPFVYGEMLAIYPPNGTSAAYTIIKAENDGKVIFDGEGLRSMFYLGSASQYLQFEGIKWINSGVLMADVNHIKILRSGAGDNTTNSSNALPFYIVRSSYILLEDVYAWGAGRYKFIFFVSDHIICRRCAARTDATTGLSGITPSVIAVFQNYCSQYVEYQNSIAIDTDKPEYWTQYGELEGGFTSHPYCDFYNEYSENTTIRGSIALNVQQSSGITTLSSRNFSFENFVSWDTLGGFIGETPAAPYNYIFDHSLFGNMTQGDGIFEWYANTSTKVKNSIFYSISGNALRNIASSDYNSFYANTVDYSGVLPGLNDLSRANSNAVDPVDGAPGNGIPALKYLTRIENSSDLDGKASDGGDIGPTILTKIGVSGTMYGDPGYNTDTGEPLWPFPYEDTIKQAFASYNPGGIDSTKPDGRRGFAADGNDQFDKPLTLTRYIWQYLGNQIPCEIYNECGGAPDTIPPIVPINLTATPISSSQINLSWTASTDNVGVAGYKIYRDGSLLSTINYPLSTYSDTNLQPSTTYSYTVSAFDAAGNESAQSVSASAATLSGADTVAPVISAVEAKDITQTQARITWTTDEPASSQVEYGRTAAYGSLTTLNLSPNTQHLTPITSLTASAIYHYRVRSKDASGNQALSADFSFATLAPPQPVNKPPVLEPIGEKTQEAGTLISFNLTASDPEGDLLTYSADNLPSGAALDSQSGQFSWPTTYEDRGIYRNILFTVSDPGGRSDFEGITIILTTPSLPPKVTATASVQKGILPLDVRFEVQASDDGKIVKYEWDFDGQGIYDWESRLSGNTTYTYTTAGEFFPTVKVTDNDGLTNSYTLSLVVLEPAAAPQVKLKARPVSGTAPLTVSLDAEVYSSVGIAKYEWDFEDDGKFDALSTASAQITHIYEIAGLYLSVLKVTDLNNVSVTDSLLVTVNSPPKPEEPYPLPWIEVKEMVLSPEDGLYEVTFTKQGQTEGIIRYEWEFEGDAVIDLVSTEPEVKHLYRSPGTYLVTLKITSADGWSGEDRQNIRIADQLSKKKPRADFLAQPQTGYAPLTTLFTDRSRGEILSYEWDFEGDGLYEIKLTQGEPALADYLSQGLSHTYAQAGNYLVQLRVTATNGLTDSKSLQVLVKAKPDYNVQFLEPNPHRKGQRIIKGSRLSLVARSNIPKDALESFAFEYQAKGEDSWQEIVNSLAPKPHKPVSVALWDTLGLTNQGYQLRAKAKDTLGQEYTSEPVSIYLDHKAAIWDIQEGLDAQGQHTKEILLETGVSDEIRVYDGTEAIIPIEVQDEAEDILVIKIIDNNSVSKKLDKDAGAYRQFSFKSGRTKFANYITLTIPYVDDNDDGLVDGTEIKESELKIHSFNSSTNTWEEAINSQCYSQENYCTAQTNHFSLFGLGSLVTPLIAGGGGGGGGGGGCFIATAVYGSEMAKEVIILKQLRDKYLLTNKFGQALVKFYYLHSPSIAEYIRDKKQLKSVLRLSLKPVVAAARMLEGTVAKYIKTVIPAKAGIHKSIEIKAFWIPAFAGMTKNSISQQSLEGSSNAK